jgi:hypothetical protein
MEGVWSITVVWLSLQADVEHMQVSAGVRVRLFAALPSLLPLPGAKISAAPPQIPPGALPLWRAVFSVQWVPLKGLILLLKPALEKWRGAHCRCRPRVGVGSMDVTRRWGRSSEWAYWRRWSWELEGDCLVEGGSACATESSHICRCCRWWLLIHSWAATWPMSLIIQIKPQTH